MPSSFPLRLRRSYPRLFRRLTRPPNFPINSNNEDFKGHERSGCWRRYDATEESGGNRGVETAWTHVEHWMWPLFTDRWEPFRQRLGLDPCPLSEDEEKTSEIAPRKGKGESDLSLGHSSTLEMKTKAVVNVNTNKRFFPLVVYLFSPLLVDVSPFWPSSVKIGGYLFPSPKINIMNSTSASPSKSKDARFVAERGGRQELSPGGGGNSVEGTAASVVGTPSVPVKRHKRQDQTAAATYSTASEDAVIGFGDQPRNVGEFDTDETPPCLPNNVESFLSLREDRPLYVGFGSMWDMCPPGYRLAFALRTMLLGVRQAGCRCIVVLPTKTPVQVGIGVGGNNRLVELDSATDFVMGEFASSMGPHDLLVSADGNTGKLWCIKARGW